MLVHRIRIDRKITSHFIDHDTSECKTNVNIILAREFIVA